MIKGRTPTLAEKKYMDSVSQLGCIICEIFHGVDSPAEIHHVEGKTKTDAHFKVIGLCFLHHRSGVNNDEFTSRHPHKKRFEQRYKTESKLISITMARVGYEG